MGKEKYIIIAKINFSEKIKKKKTNLLQYCHHIRVGNEGKLTRLDSLNLNSKGELTLIKTVTINFVFSPTTHHPPVFVEGGKDRDANSYQGKLILCKCVCFFCSSGQERYYSLAPMYYRGASAAVIVYDITQPETFDRAKDWVEEIRSKGISMLNHTSVKRH